jgi:hypothetical protein
MRTETTRLFKDMLFLQGHIADVETALAAPAPETPETEGESMNLFKSLWLLGGLQSIDLRVGDDEEAPFGQTYGNGVASRREFGKSREPKAEARAVPPTQAVRNDHCATC